MTLPKAIILEIDVCLADNRHRLRFVDPNFDETAYMLYEEVNKWGVPLDETKYKWMTGGDISENEWKPDYEAFFEGIPDDSVNEAINSIVSKFDVTHRCLFVTGRPEKYLDTTVEWLEKNYNGLRYQLFMRPDFNPNIILTSNPPKHAPDNRPSHEVKREIFEREIRDKYDVLFVIESDEECARMYRELGLTVLLCK